MPRYRLRDAAVLVGAVVVGAAAGFNGGWLAAVPPKVVSVDTPNRLAASNVDSRPALVASSPERQGGPDISAATDPRNIRVIRPVEQTNEISASGQETVARAPAQPLEDVRVPASPPPTENIGIAPAPPQPEPPAAAVTTEGQAQAAVADPEPPRTTGRSENRRPDAKKKSQKAVAQKPKRKEPRAQDVDSDETERVDSERPGAVPERSEVRQKAVVQPKTVVQKAKRKEPRQQEVDADETESESREVVYERAPARREYDRPTSRENVRGRVTVERERDRPQQREADHEEPRQGFGLFNLFDR
jgi:hypothetical protein